MRVIFCIAVEPLWDMGGDCLLVVVGLEAGGSLLISMRLEDENKQCLKACDYCWHNEAYHCFPEVLVAKIPSALDVKVTITNSSG